MKDSQLPQTQRAYINVMEGLVTHEVERQLERVPSRVRHYLKLEEVITYALNRLPTLYASSQKGLRYQQQMASRDLDCKIAEAVRQAIAAVQVDPLRLSQPLKLANVESEAVLQSLRALFQMPDLTWDEALEKINELQDESSPLTARTPAQPWQPGSHTDKVAWTHRRRRPQNLESEPVKQPETSQPREKLRGWDDPRYRL